MNNLFGKTYQVENNRLQVLQNDIYVDCYRFEHGHLFILQGESYVHCYQSATATNINESIREYEENLFHDEGL